MSLTKSTILRIAFRFVDSVGTLVSTHFGAETPYDPITLLSTLSPQHYCCILKTRFQWLVRPFWTGFPPVGYCTLAWAHPRLSLTKSTISRVAFHFRDNVGTL